MDLDRQVCSRARLARDARFDGKFFIGVLSTRIYCRPICRSRTSKEANVRYFPTAAAATEAGFRPCLRCRPECSPGTPAWAGTQTTVSRALRLINESGLEDGGVEALAERLGVGSRHLRRLFLQHLGATPSAVAQTRRLHFAKKLIDETSLPVGEVALAAGFGCVRRFNETIRRVYHRTPTQIRRLSRQTTSQAANQYLFHLDFRPPYDWKRVLEFLAARATPGVEAVEHGCYRRSISLHDQHGFLEVWLDEPKNALAVRVQFGDSRALFSLVERIRAMFDLNAEWPVIARTLRRDRMLAQWIGPKAGLRVPGCWNGFELCTRAIVEENVGVKTASVQIGRIVETFGEPFSPASGLTHIFPSAETLASANLTVTGLSPVRAETIRALAKAVCERQIGFDEVTDCDAFVARLHRIPGISEWTAQYVSMRALRDPDAFPAGDAALRHALGRCSARQLEKRSENWRPWRAYAVMLLWQGFEGKKEQAAKRHQFGRGGGDRRNSYTPKAL
jgi:AraC family transcriptional regulator of adaptative response / DNA-3-methyladenine glycosylase II